MGETQPRIGERITNLEKAVTGLANSVRESELLVSTQLTETMRQMFSKIKQQDCRRQEASRNCYGYVNWDAHDELETHSYVSLKDFHDTFRMYIREVDDDEDSEEEDDEACVAMIEVLNNAWKVNKTNRFPADGKFVNINMPKLKDHVEEILLEIEHSSTISYKSTNVSKLVQKVDDLILNNGDGVYDLEGFEMKYGLTWKDIDI